MAVSPTVLPASKPAQRARMGGAAIGGALRKRRISPEAGRALEILGHAIDYLTDEYIYRGGQFRPGDPELEALDILMAANRAIYFECPEVPSFAARCLRLFGIGRG